MPGGYYLVKTYPYHEPLGSDTGGWHTYKWETIGVLTARSDMKYSLVISRGSGAHENDYRYTFDIPHIRRIKVIKL
jgi:hypothetical protein